MYNLKKIEFIFCHFLSLKEIDVRTEMPNMQGKNDLLWLR